ncbi:hypothetical protein V6N13_111772 [Hibiscus sabdariffa]|uniref:DUF642 domain-containing protein n=1 Tax=Hibiscus sabdariffa TaxID=183260 RepID=A0ABR2TLQ8_9ROSI
MTDSVAIEFQPALSTATTAAYAAASIVFHFFFFFFFSSSSSSDLHLQIIFPIPAASKNMTGNSGVAFVLLNENNTVPGWTFQRTVQYVTAGQTVALPDNEHTIQLGQDARVDLSFTAYGDYLNYLLAFTLAPGGQNCSANAM